MNYDDLLEQGDNFLPDIKSEKMTEGELKQWHLKQVIELEAQKRKINFQQMQHKQALSEEGKADKIVELTGTVIRSIMSNELTKDTAQSVAYSDLSEDDVSFLSKEKYKSVYGLHKKVTADEEIESLLKGNRIVDIRKISKKNKPNDYINNVLNPKVQSDIDRRLKEAEKTLAYLMLAQKQNEERFSQIGNALLQHEEKFKALLTLGVAQKKIDLYKLSLEQPSLTRQELASKIGKTKPTVITWLKEVNDLLNR